MNTLRLIDSLEEILITAHKIPLTNNILVKNDEVLNILNEIRESFQEEIKKARLIVKEREQMLESARKEAEMIVKGVEINIENMINETSIKRKAQQKASEIQEKAHKKAINLEKDSEDYADNVLNILDKYIDTCSNNIKDAKRQLNTFKSKKNI